MDHLFTINVTPDETARLHNAFESSDFRKVDWDENRNAENDEITSVYLDSITEHDSFEIAEFKNKEHAEQCKNIRKNIREYIFTCFKNDGILQIENKSKKEEMNSFLKDNEGALKINLKKKKLVRIIEPLYSKDRQRNNRADVEENRYYSKEAEEEEKKRERETEENKTAYENHGNDGFRKKKNGSEDDENVYELFEEMMNKTLQEAPVMSDEETDTLIESSLLQTEKVSDSEETNVKYLNQKTFETQTPSVYSSIQNEIPDETHGASCEMSKSKLETSVTCDEMKEKEGTKDIQDNGDTNKKDGQTENLKKRKMHRIGETENETDASVEEIGKKGKIIKKKNCIGKEKSESNHSFAVSKIVLSEFRKQIKEWVTFFPNINVENFFFHLYFLVELGKNKKKACVHCGSTDCDFDEYNKSVCKNLNCFLCKIKLMEGIPCHNIRKQFNVMRTYLAEYTQNSQAHRAFDQFGATCFICSSPKHQICGTPPNVEGAKTIDFRAYRICEASLWHDVYADDSRFIWDTKSDAYYRKRDIVMAYLNERRAVNKRIKDSLSQREEEEGQTRMHAFRTGAGYRGNFYGEEKDKRVFFEEQQQSKWNDPARGDRFERYDQNERREYKYITGGKNRNYNESKWSLTDHKGNQNNNSVTGVSINYKRSGEREYSKNSNVDVHSVYHTDINNRKRVNFLENREWQEYNTKPVLQRDTNEHVAKNIQVLGQTVVYRNPYFYNVENSGREHPTKEKKWNYSKKKMDKTNNVEAVNKSSKHRFFSSNSGKHSQSIYTGSAHTYDRDVLDHRVLQDQRYNDRTNNFNNYSSGPFLNVQRGPSPLYKNVDASSERSFDQYFYGRNKNEKSFAGIGGSETCENRARGIYNIHQSTGRYVVNPNISAGNCYASNANVSSYNTNTSNNKTNRMGSGYKGKINDRSFNYNVNNPSRGNKNMQKYENNFRYNNKGDNNEPFHNSGARNMYRTKSTGSKPN